MQQEKELEATLKLFGDLIPNILLVLACVSVMKFRGNKVYVPRHFMIKCEFYKVQHMWTDGVHSILKIIHDLSAAPS